MEWKDVRRAHPDVWLVIEAVESHTTGHRRLFDRLAVVEVCPDGAAAHRRYRELHQQHPGRELYFVHTANTELDVEERQWAGIRRHDAPEAPR